MRMTSDSMQRLTECTCGRLFKDANVPNQENANDKGDATDSISPFNKPMTGLCWIPKSDYTAVIYTFLIVYQV